MKRPDVGIALCGSFCTYEKVFPVLEQLAEKYNLIPILSEAAANTDTRFGAHEDNRARIESICGNHIRYTIEEAEPIGPKKELEALVVAPCTGNTLAKLAQGITDSVVTMACKAQLRNKRPVVLALATNDGLSGNAGNIGKLLGRKDIFFVPFGQDDPLGKPTSLVADFSQIENTLFNAWEGRQIQPILLR